MAQWLKIAALEVVRRFNSNGTQSTLRRVAHVISFAFGESDPSWPAMEQLSCFEWINGPTWLLKPISELSFCMEGRLYWSSIQINTKTILLAFCNQCPERKRKQGQVKCADRWETGWMVARGEVQSEREEAFISAWKADPRGEGRKEGLWGVRPGGCGNAIWVIYPILTWRFLEK